MGLIINQSFAKIGIETTQPRLEMNARHPKLVFKQKHAKVTINTEQPKIQIDQSEAFASSGLKSFKELTREYTELAHMKVLEYIGKTAEDGDMLAAIENGGKTFIEIAARDAFPEKEIGLSFLPKARPKISLIKGQVSIDPGESPGILNGVEGEFTPGKIEYNFTRGGIKFYLLQKNFINFQFEPEKIDIHL